MCCSVDMHCSANSGQLLEQDLISVLVSRRPGCEAVWAGTVESEKICSISSRYESVIEDYFVFEFYNSLVPSVFQGFF